jgi:hypothetical protein
MRRWMAVALQVLVLVVWGYAAFTAEQSSAADSRSARPLPPDGGHQRAVV